MIDLRQTPQYSKYMENIGWTVDGDPGQYVYVKKFPIIGNFIKIQRPKKISRAKLSYVINKYNPFQIIIEPKSKNQELKFMNLGFRQSKNYFVPSKTIRIDLTKSKTQLLKDMHHKTRYNIGLRKRSTFKIELSKDIEGFAKFWQECATTQRGMFLSQVKEIIAIYNAFGKNTYIVRAVKNKSLLSAVLLIKAGDVTYYMYAASTIEGKKLFAPTVNAWECIKFAKKLGCKIFDFEGIYDERFPIESWQGFTRFKRSFGGYEVEYPGAFQKFRFSFFQFH